MSIWRILLVIVVGGFAVAYGGQARAGLVGQVMTSSYIFPTVGTIYQLSSWAPAVFTVGTGQETDGNIEGVTDILVDFTDASLTLTFKTILANPQWNVTSFNGPVFTSIAPLGIIGASVDPQTTMAGFTDSLVSFTSNDIGINWNGLSYVDDTVVKINFSFAAVPEPVSLAVFGLALAGLAAARRTKLT